jgi:hypothetical protein
VIQPTPAAARSASRLARVTMPPSETTTTRSSPKRRRKLVDLRREGLVVVRGALEDLDRHGAARGAAQQAVDDLRRARRSSIAGWRSNSQSIAR